MISPAPADAERLKEPRTKMGHLTRRLAEAAMSLIHHDSAENESEYVHEVEAMQRRFSQILRGKIR